jgi:septal ring-binding cell division protein DamX
MVMSGDERGKPNGGSCDPVEGGYTIFLDEDRIRAFMEGGDFSSASELGHFRDVGTQVEKRVKERGGSSLLALSAGEKTLSRDFAVLQIAHTLAQHGKNVLVVDCDFLHPGLSGLVENVEEPGFLDLLLYGSSLKTVSRPVGIDGVGVTGPGSFPVSRTIPFALKEFEKIEEFLRAKHDVVIYCSTLYTEDAKLNPMTTLVDGILLACRIEDMPEGELQRDLAALGAGKAPPIELVCFCAKRAQAPAPAKTPVKREEPPAIAALREEPAPSEERLATPVIEKAAELEPLEAPEPREKPRVNVGRIVAIAVLAVVVVFVVWWVAIQRTVRGRVERPSTAAVAESAAAPPASSSSVETSSPAESLAASAPETAQAIPGEAARTPGETSEAAGAGAAADTMGTIAAGPARYTIHVASFKEMSRAEVEKAYLEKNGFAARIVAVDIKGEHWLRVLAGGYATKGEAEKARLDLLGLREIGYARVVSMQQATQ